MKEKLKKSIILFAVVLVLSACTQEKEEVYNEEHSSNLYNSQNNTEEAEVPEFQTWQDAYIEIICNL